jgi:hypothetical protein
VSATRSSRSSRSRRSSVGYGDLTPSIDGAKLFTVVYIITGISIIGTFLDARFKKRAYQRATRFTNAEQS